MVNCDGGVPSLWEYGYFVTDEGYYVLGGKEKFLFNHFVDLARYESYSYGFSSGTHILSWLAHCLFGLSAWKWRIPFFAINLIAWGAFLNYLAKRTLPLIAFVLCLCVSLTPMMIAYERTASNDVLIGSLIMLAYIAARRKSVWTIGLAAVLCSSVVLIKPSVWLLIPLVLSGVLARLGNLRLKARNTGLFLLLSVLAIAGFRAVARWLVVSDAATQNVTAAEIIKRTTTHYPLPNLLDVEPLFRGMTSFPRHPAGVLLGVWAVLLFVVPLTLLARRIFVANAKIRFDHRLLLYVMVPAYVAGISVMNTLYTHYYIPMMMMFPLLWVEMRHDLRGFASEKWGKKIVITVGLAVCAVVGALSASAVHPQTTQSFFAMIYNLPQKNVWLFTWGRMAAWLAVLMAGYCVMQFRSLKVLPIAGFALSVVCAMSVCYAQFPAFLIAPYIKLQQGMFGGSMSVCLGVSALFVLLVWCLPKWVSSARAWYLFLPLALVSGMAFIPTWRNGYGELAARTQHHAKAAEALARALPKDAIVLGERSNQVLMATPIRTAGTFPTNSDPIPIVKQVLEKEPSAKLFALIDPEHSYNYQHYQKNKDWITLRPVTTVKLPSFGTGRLIDIHLAEIHANPAAMPK